MKLSTEQKKLGDFTTTLRVLPISGLAMVIGLIGAFVALALSFRLLCKERRKSLQFFQKQDGQD
jgi:hypothetical protein